MTPFVRTLALTAALAGSAVAADPAPYQPGKPDTLIPEHGRYSGAYASDWSTLPTGDTIARRDPATFQLQEVVGEDVRQTWRDEDRVHLTGKQLSVKWTEAKADKFKTTLFAFDNVDEVVIEDLVIVQNDPDYRGWDTIRVEGADRVIIRNVHIAGPVHSYHIRLEGVGDLLVENVEIAGIDFDGDGRHRVGGGLWINNGATNKNGEDDGMYTRLPRIPGWQVVQNCYFHDGSESDDTPRNQDAVLIHSASHGVLFNCVVENWLRPAMESSFDLSFRRREPEYQDRFFRVERNILRNTTFYKNVGNTPGPNTLLWANNLFVNAQLADYHGTNDAYFVHNTYLYDLDLAPPALRSLAQRGAAGYAALWAFTGPTHLVNSLLFKPQGDFFLFYLNNDPPADKHTGFFPDHNVYALPAASTGWLRTATEGLKFRTLDDWRAATQKDAASVRVEAGPDLFRDYAGGDFRLADNPWPDVASRRFLDPRDEKMRVDRDFAGRLRSEAESLAPGAFVAEPSAD